MLTFEKILHWLGAVLCLCLAFPIYRAAVERNVLINLIHGYGQHSPRISLSELRERMDRAQEKLAQARASQSKTISGRQEALSDMPTTFGDISKEPDFVKGFSRSIADKIVYRYDALFSQLALNSAQRELLTQELVHRNYGIGYDDAGANSGKYLTSIEQARAVSDNKIKSILEPSQFAFYQKFQNELPSRNLIARLSNLAAINGEPVEPSQATALLQLFMNESSDDRAIEYANANSTRLRKAVDESTSFVGDKILQEGRSILGPRNAGLLEQLRIEQNAELAEQRLLENLKAKY